MAAMKRRVTLLDYGAGNVRSVRNALEKLGCEVLDVTSAADIEAAEMLLFPGVGAFAQAVAALEKMGVMEALRAYLSSPDRPFLGICIGMQVLFESSEESPGVRGLDVVPGAVRKFAFDAPAVPHMGWNEAAPVKAQGLLVDARARYYFVHSFRVTEAPEAWRAAVTDYGGERFVSAIQRGRQCAVQFHPEKSGPPGLALLRKFVEEGAALASEVPLLMTPPATTVLAPRVICALDVRTNDAGDLVVTKGDGYDVREKKKTSQENTATKKGEVRNLGKPVDLCARYYDEGADEIAILNICAFKGEPLGDLPLLGVLRRASERCFVPITIGGGIRAYTDQGGCQVSALDVASAYFRAGADKVSIGSDAVAAAQAYYLAGQTHDGTSSISEIARQYGRQAVVVSIDPRRVWLSTDDKSPLSPPEGPHGPYAVVTKASPGPNDEARCWYECTVSGGRRGVPMDAVQLARAAEALGAGEVMLNCIDADGKNTGYDLELIALVKRSVSIPVIASSGAGMPAHFVQALHAGADAALAAGIFHRKEVEISAVKQAIAQAGFTARGVL